MDVFKFQIFICLIEVSSTSRLRGYLESAILGEHRYFAILVFMSTPILLLTFYEITKIIVETGTRKTQGRVHCTCASPLVPYFSIIEHKRKSFKVEYHSSRRGREASSFFPVPAFLITY